MLRSALRQVAATLARVLGPRSRHRPPSARIDGIEFFSSGESAGGSFMLNEASKVTAVEIVDKWVTEVQAGSRIVVARGAGPDSFERARAESIDAANKGLDLLSARGVVDVSIREAEDQHISWWVERGCSVIRVLSVPTVQVHVGDVTVTGGMQIVPPPLWHESLRYFRLSQITDDLVDAYRNLYLGLECLLDTIAPQRSGPTGKPAEGEGAWFRRALVEAGNVVSLAGFVPQGTPDPVQALWDDLYRDVRSALFHAKASRPTIVPHGSNQRQEIAESLTRATALYLALAKYVLHIRRPGGGIFAGFWRMQTDALVGRLSIVATDDPAPVSPDDEDVNRVAARL